MEKAPKNKDREEQIEPQLQVIGKLQERTNKSLAVNCLLE